VSVSRKAGPLGRASTGQAAQIALGDGRVDDPTFRRLSYEIAFSEYAMGLGYELSKQDPNMPPDDLLYEVRSTLNRISTAAVALYR
jgi:hypothetical protein